MLKEQVRLIPREIREAQYPEARFLSAEEQVKYEELCKSFGDKAKGSLNIAQKGSNLWKVLLLNQNGIRTAILPELEFALENGMGLQGTYEDARSVVLRSSGDFYAPNNYLAEQLAELAKIRSFPHSVVIEGLNIREDEHSEYGLSFSKGEGFRVIKAPALDHTNNQRRFKRINPDYTVDFDKEGTRTLYTKQNGLSGLCLGGNLDLWSDYENLAYSGSGGRVLVVSAEGTSPKILNEYLTNLRTERDAQIAQVQARFAQAEKVMKGQ